MSQPPDDQAEARPWEMPGAVRRDCETHRAALLNCLATVAFLFSMFIPCTFGFGGLVGLPLGIVVCWMARTDLKQMDRRLMDTDGRAETRSALHLAVGALVMCVLPVVGVVWAAHRF